MVETAALPWYRTSLSRAGSSFKEQPSNRAILTIILKFDNLVFYDLIISIC